MTCRACAPFLIAVFALLWTGCSRSAPEGQVVEPSGTTEQVYATRCQPCHGAGGAAVDFLTVPASDLTRLVDKYGTFPAELVMMTIDGRADVESHGTRTMPVWGNIWSDPEGGPLSEERSQEQIRRLVEYIRDLQVSPAATSEH